MYTSHWRSPLLADVDAQVVGISRGTPRWPLPFRYRKLPALAPDERTWAQEDQEQFEASYTQQLEKLGTERILADLKRMSGGRPVVMLCWERDPTDPETPCHRRYLAEFLECEAGVSVPELEPAMLPRRPDAPQPSLFDDEGKEQSA